LGFRFFFGFFFRCCGTEAPTSAPTSLATQAGQKTNAHVSQLAWRTNTTYFAMAHLLLLLCLLLFLLLCQLLLPFPIAAPPLLHCELKLLRRVCLRKEGIDFLGAALAPTIWHIMGLN
jgi:hypothetical protein